MREEVVTLGGGCFWCLEAVFDEVAGVHSVESGYMGGQVPDPTYQQVCTGKTGHAEITRIRFDTDLLSFRELLGIFFAIHDPTTLNRQGNDVGSQYRSVIFYHSTEQKNAAEQVIAELRPEFKNPIITEVTAETRFYIAEDYHQEYFANNPNQPYCQMIVWPKVEKFRSKFSANRKVTA